MSSRSKERVTAVIRKIFRSPGANSKNKTNGNTTNTTTTTTTNSTNNNKTPDDNAGVVDASAAVAKSINDNNNSSSNANNANTNNGNGPPSSNNNNNNGIVANSPGKRLRCAISPTSKLGVPVPKPIDTTIRSRRLMKEFKEIQRTQHSKPSPAFTVELISDNLYEWHARLYHIDPDSLLADDMREFKIDHILLHVVFPDNFPFAPPFMRVVEPHIEKGFVMEGGAICMELLTPRGWASAYTVEALLMQFAASLVKGQGRISRKVKGNKEFSKRSAEEAFRSLVKTHDKYGWVTPSLSDG
ncbi:ubiquitin-conjugating enzyme E2Q-like protein 1 isoform X2 [Culicoides brevitarsis]|uniref:ubiquitin-conjugating enzyme E2Q-like protein 1 isoform X2 n=1 Tax=Culicoides brevitarsis TaxID=469753 RepID=UPI00307B697D